MQSDFIIDCDKNVIDLTFSVITVPVYVIDLNLHNNLKSYFKSYTFQVEIAEIKSNFSPFKLKILRNFRLISINFIIGSEMANKII